MIEFTIEKKKLEETVASAQEVVEEFLDCGHDDISVLDVLDVLASTGYTLTKDTQGISREAYIYTLPVDESLKSFAK
jgi:hypothetical protein